MSEQCDIEFLCDDGITIRAHAYGDPSHPPVILAHGGGQTRHSWGGTASTLADLGWYAICYDHRGHGDSDWSHSNDYPTDRFAKDQINIAESLLQAPVLIGASLGGIAAMIAQGSQPHREIFAAIVLVDITPNMNRDGAVEVLEFMGRHMEAGFSNLEEAADAISGYTGRPRRKDLSGLSKNLRHRNGRWYWHWDPGFVEERLEDNSGPERLMVLCQSIQQPMMLIRGRESNLVTEEQAQEFLNAVPSARYADVANARHMVAGDRNDIFTQAVSRFLEEFRTAA